MKLAELLPALHGVVRAGDAAVEVRAVTRDSREVAPGMAFVAVAGARVDGHALVAGLPPGSVAVVERGVTAPDGVAVVEVADTRAALGQIAAALHGHPSRRVPVVAVTGTNGKTSVTHLLAQAATSAGRVAGCVGTLGAWYGDVRLPGALTTPEAPQLQAWLAEMAAAGCALVAVEASSIGLVQRRLDGVEAHVGVFTMLGHDHLDFHGTFEAYAAAKARLFTERLRAPGGGPRALVNLDDPAWEAMRPPADRWGFGFSPAAEVRIHRWARAARGSALELHTPAGTVAFDTPLVGRHNALNLAAAVGAGLLVGLGLDALADGLSRAPGAPGRLQPVAGPPGSPVVLVDYAHTPDALATVLASARDAVAPGGALWVVFGCGGDRDRAKRPEMARAALAADRVIVTSDNPRSERPEAIVAEVLAGVPGEASVAAVVDRRAAIAAALSGARAGDVVVVAGKGHETTQVFADHVEPFDDREVARGLLWEQP